MSQPDPNQVRRLLDEHWTTLENLIEAAAGVQDPMGPDPDLFAPLAGALESMAKDARAAGFDALGGLAVVMASIARGFGDGSMDPFGPAGGLVDEAVRGVEESLVLLEAGEGLDEPMLAALADKIGRVLAPIAPAPIAPAPAPIAPAPAPIAPAPAPIAPSPAQPVVDDDDFLDEVEAHVDNLRSGFSEMVEGRATDGLLDDLLRSAQLVAQQSTVAKVEPLELVARSLVEVLDDLRQGAIAQSQPTMKVLGRAADGLMAMVEQLRARNTVEHDYERDIEALAWLPSEAEAEAHHGGTEARREDVGPDRVPPVVAPVVAPPVVAPPVVASVVAPPVVAPVVAPPVVAPVVAPPVVAPVVAPPVVAPLAPAASFPVESWGPWEPAYADMEDDYFEEVESHVDNLQNGLVQLSGGQADPDLVNDLFRSSHSIKGQSGQMNAGPLERVAHKLEDVLDRVRERKLTLTPTSAEVLLEVIDALSGMLGQLRDTRCIAHPIAAEIDKMDRVIRGEDVAPAGTAPVTASAPEPVVPAVDERAGLVTRPYTGGAQVPTAPVAPAADERAGLVTRPYTGGAQEPTAAPVVPASTAAPVAPASTAAAPVAPAPKPAPAGKPVQAAKSTAQSKAQYLRVDFAKVDRTLNRVGDLFINKIRLTDAVHALDDLQFQVSKLQNVLSRVRDTGERDVVIAREDAVRLQEGLARLEAEMERATDHLSGAMGETDMISSDLRDQVMEMRMVPVDSILGRLGRVVFDALQKENRGFGANHKRAKLDVIGSDTEIDKMIANMLEVPLVHIVRNSIAHGIEPAEERVAAGKPAEGTVRIHAHQQGSRFVIETTDDGRGMDPVVIGRVAVSKGLITAEEVAQMTEKEVLGLIFRAGFTTAEKADDLKGRGVGLDEVMDKIRTIKGSVEVSSVVGKGCRVELSLPLTLAITTVVLGEIDTETLALPMSAVERVVYLDEGEIESMGEAEVFTLQGQTVPLVRLDDLLGMGRPPSKRPDACYVTVIQVGDKRLGLAMDRMGGQREVVIKSLGSLLKEVPLISGSTLLGDRCVLILNPTEIAAALVKPIARALPSTGGHAHTAQGARRRALLVDDDAITRLALRRIFEQAGLEVHEAADGAEALAVAQTNTFSVVSTDVVMPRMDGYELTRRLRAIPSFHRTPILMITSKDLEVDRRAGFEAGVDHYITKPFERGALLDLVEEVLS